MGTYLFGKCFCELILLGYIPFSILIIPIAEGSSLKKRIHASENK